MPRTLDPVAAVPSSLPRPLLDRHSLPHIPRRQLHQRHREVLPLAELMDALR